MKNRTMTEQRAYNAKHRAECELLLDAESRVVQAGFESIRMNDVAGDDAMEIWEVHQQWAAGANDLEATLCILRSHAARKNTAARLRKLADKLDSI